MHIKRTVRSINRLLFNFMTMGLGEILGIGLPWTPWRIPDKDFKWDFETAEKLKNEIKAFEGAGEDGRSQFKALIIGAHGHGKSSLINTFASTSVGYKTSVCNAASQEQNVTKHYRNIELPGQFGHCAIGDISGFPKRTDIQPFLKDIKFILEGHIKSGYKFDENNSISSEDEHYESSPNFSDKIHCAIIVVDGAEAYEIHPAFVLNIKAIMETIHSMNVPVMVVLTKSDKVSKHVKYDVESIFRSKGVHNAVKKTADQLSIPTPKVYPVVNFEEMDHFTWKDSIPICIVLRSFLRFAQQKKTLLLNGHDMLDQP